MKKVCVIKGKRIPFCKSGTAYLGKTNLELMSTALAELVRELNLTGKEVGEVVLGAVNKHSYDFNLARESVIESGLSLSTPAYDIQRACGTSLEAAGSIAYKIMAGEIEAGIAGGVDTNSDVPIELKKNFSDKLVKMNYSKTFGQKLKAFSGLSFKDLIPSFPAVKEARTGLSMGESCEIMAKNWSITRDEQDQLAFESHKRGAEAYEAGFYDDMVVEAFGTEKDNILRPNTTFEGLQKLRACFDRSEAGTLTAGNSSSLSDGASCVFLCSDEYAKENNLEVMAYLTHVQSAAVDYLGEEGLLMAPAYAVPKMLKRAGMKLQDFDFYEIHEAFAAQVLCTMKAWESPEFCKDKLKLTETLGSIDRSKLNVKGGSLALGHPFAATGSRIIASGAKTLHEAGGGKLLISICTAGGMGVTAILEK